MDSDLEARYYVAAALITVIALLIAQQAHADRTLARLAIYRRRFLEPQPREPRRARIQEYLKDALAAREHDPERFRADFRLSPRVFNLLLERLRPHLELTSANSSTPETALLLTLHRLGTRSYLHVVADRFGVSTATAFRLYWRTVKAIVRSIAPEVIRWPHGDELVQVRKAFAAFGLRGAVGAIDCTHINVHPPTSFSKAFLDRKRQHSIIAQAVVDHRGLVRDLVSGAAGSNHDSSVFFASKLYKRIMDGDIVGGNDFLLADSGYRCLRFLITPYDFRSGFITPMQERFNLAHSRARVVVERTFGLVKGRYRILLDSVEGASDDVNLVVLACFALHNFGLLNGEEDLEAAPQDEDDDQYDPRRELGDAAARRQGQLRRQEVVDAWRAWDEQRMQQ